jgi:uncharacterized protein (TIGR00369 family)
MISEENKQAASEVVQNTPYLKLLGIKLEEISEEKVVMSLEMQEKLRQPYGLLHGGATASLIDTATAFAVITSIGTEEKATTVDLTIQYLRPHTEGKVICTARVLRTGKRMLFLSAEAVNEQGKLIATALSTYTKV